ncbi:hypothetical protein P3581_23280, partial [Vibrio parahaemolyticus]|nr:hypothetical protein [Vibrio parahaemolyticus]
ILKQQELTKVLYRGKTTIISKRNKLQPSGLKNRSQHKSTKNCASSNGHLRLAQRARLILIDPHVKMPNFTAEINMFTEGAKNGFGLCS